jgi:hypothetical protein
MATLRATEEKNIRSINETKIECVSKATLWSAEFTAGGWLVGTYR